MRRAFLLVLLIMVGSAMADTDSDSCENWVVSQTLDSSDIAGVFDSICALRGVTAEPTVWIYSIFYIDTVGWRADTTFEEYNPYTGPGFHTLELNYRQFIRWHPVLDTTYIGKLVSDKREPMYDHLLLVKREKVK